MPTVLRVGPYRFGFYSGDHEPPHVHVMSGDGKAVFNLYPVEPRDSIGYTPKEMTEIREIVLIHRAEFLRRWHEHFTQ